MMLKRVLWIVLALGLFATAAVWFARGREAERAGPARLDYLRPERRELRQTVVLHGRVAPALSTELRSEVSGRVSRVLVAPGDRVEAGQPLVELDQRDFKVRMDEARPAIESARLRVERAELEYKRLEPLAARDFVNARELKEAEISRDLALNDLEVQRARLRLLETALERSSVRAPYAGTILSVAARPGLVVTGADSGFEGRVVLVLADLTRLRVEAAVNEMDVASLSVGQPVEIAFDSIPGLKAPGELAFIAPAAGKGADAAPDADVKPREYPVRIVVSDPDARIRPGMTARLKIETARADSALALPATVVFHDFEKDESYVWGRVEGDAPPVRIKVEVGVRDSEWIEIRSGLESGREVSRQSPEAPADPEKSKNNS